MLNKNALPADMKIKLHIVIKSVTIDENAIFKTKSDFY